MQRLDTEELETLESHSAERNADNKTMRCSLELSGVELTFNVTVNLDGKCRELTRPLESGRAGES